MYFILIKGNRFIDYVDKLYVGRVIRQKRKDLGLKQSELAEMVGISEKHLSKIETGKNYPALDNFFKMTEILKLSLKDFVSEGIDMADISSNKNKLKMIVNIATEQQVNMYLDMIEVINHHIK